MLPDLTMSQVLKASKVDIASKGLTAAGASLLANESPIACKEDGVQQNTSLPPIAKTENSVVEPRVARLGGGDGSDQGFQESKSKLFC